MHCMGSKDKRLMEISVPELFLAEYVQDGCLSSCTASFRLIV